jgi:hypothetical protein
MERRAAEGDSDQRDGAFAFRRMVTVIGARFCEIRPGAERQRAVSEFGQRRDARMRRARGPIRAQRLQEHAGAPG